MFFDNKMAVSYLFTELGVVCVVVNITCCTWINTSGEVGTQLPKITDHLASESDSLSKVPLIYLSWFESWGPWLQSTLQMFGIILFTVILIVYLVHYVVSKALNACLEQLATRQTISLHLEHQK